jgi:hypothetical protein
MEQYKFEQKESLEKGNDVEIMVKFLRHGERDKEGRLTDHGREITVERAIESGIGPEDFDAVKAIGSDAGMKSGVGRRAFETADIYAHTVAGDKALHSRVQKLLSFEELKNPVPYDHVKIYNANLPEDFGSLSNEDKVEAAKKAQSATIDYLMALDTPEAEAYKKEMAGAFAILIQHYSKMAKRLKSGSRVLLPAGTHGGVMEFLLQKALVYRGRDGNQKMGFIRSEEVGGEFSPSEAYNVEIATNEQGSQKPLKVTFDNQERPITEEAYLDENEVRALADYYKDLHKDDVVEDAKKPQ